MRKLLPAICALAILIGTPAFAADSASCLRRNDVRDWSSTGHKTLLLESYSHRKVQLKLTGNCAGFGPYDSFQITGPLQTAASCIVEGETDEEREKATREALAEMRVDVGRPAERGAGDEFLFAEAFGEFHQGGEAFDGGV